MAAIDDDYLVGLNDHQRHAVLHWGRPLLIVAGAGSGKTRVITSTIAHLIRERALAPGSILAVTFTNKAAGEMVRRVAALLPDAPGVAIRTFHSFGAWLLRRYASAVGLPRGFSIYDDSDATTVLGRLLKGQGDVAPPDVQAAARWISLAKNRGVGPDEDLSGLPRMVQFDLPDLYRRYQDQLVEAGAVDFGDLILRSVELLRDTPVVRTAVRRRFRAVLVDEYQDANHAQFLLLQQLHDPSAYLCVVGDDDQSIYRFRGAEIGNFLDFPKLFEETHVVRLEQNYRSTSPILAAAHSVVARNQGRMGKQLWTKRDEGPLPQLYFLPDQEDEVRLCLELIATQPGASTAILYRMNFQSQPFERALRQANIDYQLVGTVGFFERAEVKDALAYLRLLQNPRDTVALRRALQAPRRGVGQRTLDTLLKGPGLDAAGQAPLFPEPRDAITAARQYLLRAKGRIRQGLQEFLRVLDQLRVAVTSAGEAAAELTELVRLAITTSGLSDFYASDADRIGNLQQLVDAAAGYPGSGEGLQRFLEDCGLDRGRDREAGEQAPPRVTLITLHNTKGLEFDQVIVTGLEEGIFPPGEAGFDAAEVEEERRLLYVGMTRARTWLHLVSCGSRMVFGRWQSREPSRFLAEVPRDLVEVHGEQEQDEFPEGAGVYHDDYGAGMIVRRWTHEAAPFVAVQFESGREATFALKYSRLERISSD